MASTSRSFETVVSIEPSASSYLFESRYSGSVYSSTNSEVSQRSITPAECIIRQEWYEILYATLLEYWENIRELFAGSWCPFLGGKLEAILRCLCLPCVVLTRTLNGRRRYFNPQTGIMYLYIYLGVTVVLNLIVALKRINISTAEDIQKYFVIISTVVALALMLYLFLFVYETVEFPNSRGKLLRLFYEGGFVVIFGFTSFGYSVGVVIQYISCGQVLDAIVTGIKALFILVQILFVHFFYEARIPEDSPYIDIIMAHLLGTNLGLWFWTLCSEAGSEIPTCIGNLRKYFLPFFVEYLLLAASLLYQIWEHSSTRDPSMSLLQRYITQQSNLPENASRRDSPSNFGNTSSTSDITIRCLRSRSHDLMSGLGFIIGGFFAALFVVLVVFAHFDTGSSDQGYHIAYSVGTLILYLTQVCACYICQLSLQSHQRNPERFSPDHEDILLYFSLVGIVLWEAFHAYSLLLSGSDYDSGVILDLGGDILAIAQHLFQTTTLVKLRRHQRMQGQCSVWICACVLFLLTTNFIFWAQDSFLIEVAITTPGEKYIKLEYDLGTVGYIIHPLTIFYRFHSSVCCVLAWSIFRN